MQFNNFKRIVTCFADRVDDVDTSHGELLVQIRDETITAKLHQRPSGLLVEEHDTCMPAAEWIVKRLARLPLLADRICSYVSPPEHFVPSSGRFLDKLEADPSGKDKLRPDVAEAMTQTLGRAGRQAPGRDPGSRHRQPAHTIRQGDLRRPAPTPGQVAPHRVDFAGLHGR